MTDTTWMKQRVPSSVILGCEDDCQPHTDSCEGPRTLGGVGAVLSEHAAAMTWKLCKEGVFSREELPREVMLDAVKTLLA